MMSTLTVYQVAFELWGAVFLLISAVVVLVGRKINPVTGWILFSMLLLNAVLLVNDSLAYIYRGDISTAGFYVVRVSNFVVFLITPLLTVATLEYLAALGSYQVKKIRLLRILAFTFGGIFVVLMILSSIHGWFYYFDAQNVYHRGDWYIVPWLFAIIEIAILLAAVILSRHHIVRSERNTMVAFILLPVISNIVQFFFYGLSLNNIAVTVAILLVLVNYEMEKSHRFSEQEQRLLKQELTILQQQSQIANSQIQPHFAFNVLGTIEQLCRTDADKAGKAVHHFARYLRANLNTVVKKPMIGFCEELETIRNYVWLEKMRFGDDFLFSEEIGTDDFFVPSISVQPMVENAIKHGMRNVDEDPLHIILRTEELEDAYRISIIDDGIGFDPDKAFHDGRNHIGIHNVSSRIKSLCGGTITIESKIDNGTSVIITLPKSGQNQPENQ